MPETVASETVRAHVAHRIPGRVRLRLESELADRRKLEALADTIAALPGVRRVDIRAETGSVLIVHTGAFETVSQGFSEAGLRIAKPRPQAPLDPVGDMGRRLFMADIAVRQASRNQVDLWNAAFLILVSLALWQLGRGRVAGPALTVLGQAATLALSRPYQPSASTPK